MTLILASKSEARAMLLRAAGYAFTQFDSRVVESPPQANIRLTDYVAALASKKALAVSRRHPDAVVIGADTALAIDRQIIGKADDAEQAVNILRKLAGRTHRLSTGVCVIAPAGRAKTRIRVGADTARVTLRAWSENRIRQYVQAVKPFACAGAYALQADGSAIIERIDGDPSTVIGLPIGLVERMLSELKGENVVKQAKGRRPSCRVPKSAF